MIPPIPLCEALEKIKELKHEFYFRRGSEKVALSDSVGRELSETIFARSMSPEFDIAAMDGFAVRSEDGYPLKITGRAYAGDRAVTIGDSEAVAIATGAFMPGGADAVLKMEDAKVENNIIYGRDIKKWENVFRAGSDYRAGDRIFEKNQRIMPQSAALLYSLGVERVPVYKKIRTGIISTGTEIHNGMIKNTNAVLIQGFMRELGCDSRFIGTVPDDYDRTKEMLLQACGNYDSVFTTGGVSVGERDYVADIIAEAGELVFHRVAIRPGKPIAVGVVKETPVFALPGKPTGAFAALEMVVRGYFTDIPRAAREFVVNEDVVVQEKGFSYILFVKVAAERANIMGYGGSDMKLFKTQYETAIIASSPRSTVVDGYVITDRDIKKGETVKVHLFSGGNMDKKTVELAVALHGHLAPGIALGLRMCELALSRMGMKKGDKHLIGVSETARCLADAVQAAAGCTLGHGNAFVEDYGKLAIAIGDSRTKRGVRVALRDDAVNFSELMNRWMMRLGKLSYGEEDELSKHLLVMDREHFSIQDIEMDRNQDFDSSAIARCSGCGEFVPVKLVENKSDGVYCKACRGYRYYKVLQAD